MPDFTYPKQEKLKGKSEIDLLFAKGKWRSYGNLRIIILKNHPEINPSGIKIGVSVSKKFFKRAVHRNRIKRLLRETYRLHKDIFNNAFGEKTVAMLFWASKDMPGNFHEVEEQFIKLCDAQKKT